MFSAQVEEHATKNKSVMDVQQIGGFVLDQGMKAFVTKLVPITSRHFCIDNAGMFRHALTRGALWVLVQRSRVIWEVENFVPYKALATGQPEYREVEQIDGRVMVLKSPLNYEPIEGACVQRIAAMDWKYARDQDLDKREKEEKRKGGLRWL